jgi:predicted dehydrogenase
MRKRGLKRRDFLKGALATGAGLTVWGGPKFQSAWAGYRLADSEIRVAIVGCGGRGRGYLLNEADAAADVRVTALCDPDNGRMTTAFNQLTDNTGVFTSQDVRDLVDRTDIDAFLVGSNTHWHSLHTIWPILAGKDVFCEKPVSHNIAESRLMALAADSHYRILQIGVQRRASTGAQNAKAYLADGTTGLLGALGPIQYIYCWWYNDRSPGIGLQSPWTPSFPDLDFDLYMGPRDIVPLTRGQGSNDIGDVHNGWHYSWDTGNGDLSNLGIHVFDQARYIAGIPDAPTRVRCIGNRYVFGDAGVTPNAQFTLLDYPHFPVLIENRGVSSSGYSPAPGTVGPRGSGFHIQCQHGYAFGFEDVKIYDNSHNELGSWPAGPNGADFISNFFDVVRSRDAGSLIAPIGDVNPTNDACLLGNASYRMGTPADKDTIRAAVAGLGAAPDRFESMLAWLAGLSVDVDTDQLKMGPWLTFDETGGEVTEVNGSAGSEVATANALLTDAYRAPFTIPDQVPVELSKFTVD